MANPFLLDIHSLLRWVFVFLAIYVIVNAFIGWQKTRKYSKTDDQLLLSLMIVADIQLVIGLILYFTGAYGYKVTQMMPMGEIMKDPSLRFFVVEHFLGMILAIVLLHIGRAKVKNEKRGTSKYKKTFWWVLIVFIIVMMMIPWPTNPIFEYRGWI